MWHRIIRNIDARRLVFVDEFGVNIRLARLFGWAPKGTRSRGSVPRNYGKNLSVCAALSLAFFIHEDETRHLGDGVG